MGIGRVGRARVAPQGCPHYKGMFGGGPVLVGIDIGVGAASLYTQAEEEGPRASSVTLVQCGMGSVGKAGVSGKRGLKMVKPLGVAMLWHPPLHTVQENS